MVLTIFITVPILFSTAIPRARVFRAPRAALLSKRPEVTDVIVSAVNVSAEDKPGEYILNIRADAGEGGACALLFSVRLPDTCRVDRVCWEGERGELSCRCDKNAAVIMIDAAENIACGTPIELLVIFSSAESLRGRVEISAPGGYSQLRLEENGSFKELSIKCNSLEINIDQEAWGEENGEKKFLACQETVVDNGKYCVNFIFVTDTPTDTRDFSVYVTRGGGVIMAFRDVCESLRAGDKEYKASEFGKKKIMSYRFCDLCTDTDYEFHVSAGESEEYSVIYIKGRFLKISNLQQGK